MTRRFAPTALLFTLTAALGGCTTVHVARPVGSSPAALDPAAWNGTWCDVKDLEPQPGTRTLLAPEAECLRLTVVDPAAGVLDVDSPAEPDDAFRAHLRHVGDDRDTILVSVEDGAAFAFELRARRDGDAIVVWGVSGDAIAAEIAAGRIPGHVRDGSVWLDPPSPAVLARIAGDAPGLFDWKRPSVLVRVQE